MKKILLGVAVVLTALAMTGCGGLGASLKGDKFDATFTMDSTKIGDSAKIADNATAGFAGKTWKDVTNDTDKNMFYQREWKRLGSLEKAEALSSTITVDLASDKSVLVSPADDTRKAVWGFAFDFDTNAKGSNLVDFCLVGIRQKAPASGSTPAKFEYYLERYLDIPESYAKANGGGVLTNKGSLGPYCSTMKNKTWDGNLYEAGPEGTYTNFSKTASNVKGATTGADDWNELSASMYTADAKQFSTVLSVVQDTAGTYVIYLGKSDSEKVKIGEFGVKGTAKNLERQETTAKNVFRYGPVSKKGFIMGGIAAYASCPYNTKLSVHYDTPKAKIQGGIFAAPIEE